MLKFLDLSGANDCKSCRSRKMLQNEYLVAIVATHTAENEPFKVSPKWGSHVAVSGGMLAPRRAPRSEPSELE